MSGKIGYSSTVSVEIPKVTRVVFPKLCPRCLKPATSKVELRHFSYDWIDIHIKKISVPICKECWWKIMPKHLLTVIVFGWGLVALGLFLGMEFQNGWGIAAFFLCLIASRIVRDRNPLGVSFTETRKGYLWSFPNRLYAEIFASLNSGRIVEEVSPTSQANNVPV